MTQAIDEEERYRDPAVEKRLAALDEEFVAVHPGVLVERDGVHVHHRREGDHVTVAVVSGGELRALRARLARFARFVSAHGGSAPDGIDRLAAELSAPGPDLDAVETALRDDGLAASAAVYRRLLEAQDDDLDPPACPKCGGVMKRHGPKRAKTLTTRLGKVTVERSYCRCTGCGKGLCPLDARLGIEGRSMTPGTERMVMAAAAETGSRRASQLVEELSGVRVSRSRFDREARSLGSEVVEFERKEAPDAPDGPPLPVVSADGTGVPMRKPELEGRAGRQEDGTSKTREAKLLRICEVARNRKGRVSAVAGSITQSSVIDSAEASGGGMSEFAARLWREAKRRGALHGDEVVILSDGAKWIENATRKVFAGMKLTFVLDIFHVLERLQDALKEMMPDSPERKAAFDRLKGLIKAGDAALAVEELAPHGSRCEAVAEFVRYCRPNLYRMRYDECRRRGIPCGSGIIEGGCRTVVVDRLKKSGSRWSVDGANGIMAIRCCKMNNRVADFFQWRVAA